jgi:hypothetical protein
MVRICNYRFWDRGRIVHPECDKLSSHPQVCLGCGVCEFHDPLEVW